MLGFYLSALDTAEEKDKFTRFYEKYKDFMVARAMRYVHSEVDSEDIVHNVFLYIIQHKEKYFSLNDKEFRRNSVILTTYRCLDFIRNKREHIPFEEVEAFLSSDDDLVEVAFENKEQRELIKKALAELDGDCFVIVSMKYFLRMNYAKISEQTGYNIDKITNIVRKSKKKLREILKEQGIDGRTDI